MNPTDRRRYEAEDLLQLADDLLTAADRAKEAGFAVGPSALETFEHTANELRLAARGDSVGTGDEVPPEVGEAAVDRVRLALAAFNARLGLS